MKKSFIIFPLFFLIFFVSSCTKDELLICDAPLQIYLRPEICDGGVTYLVYVTASKDMQIEISALNLKHIIKRTYSSEVVDGSVRGRVVKTEEIVPEGLEVFTWAGYLFAGEEKFIGTTDCSGGVKLSNDEAFDMCIYQMNQVN